MNTTRPTKPPKANEYKDEPNVVVRGKRNVYRNTKLYTWRDKCYWEKMNHAIPTKIWGLPLKTLVVSATLGQLVMGILLKIRWKVIDLLDFSAQKMSIYLYHLLSICSKSLLFVGLFWGIDFFFRMAFSQLALLTHRKRIIFP